MFWTEGGPSKITTFLSTGLQSIECQLPAQSRQGSSSEFLGQQWIQLPGVGEGQGAFITHVVFHLRARVCLLPALFAVLVFSLAGRCPALFPEGG